MKNKTLSSKRKKLFKDIVTEFAHYKFANNCGDAEGHAKLILVWIEKQDREFISDLKEKGFYADKISMKRLRKPVVNRRIKAGLKNTMWFIIDYNKIEKLAGHELANHSNVGVGEMETSEAAHVSKMEGAETEVQGFPKNLNAGSNPVTNTNTQENVL